MQAIEKQLLVLESIAKVGNEQGFSIADLVHETGLNSSAVHRIFSVLTRRGYIYQKHKRGPYFIGHKFLLFNGIHKHATGIKEQALPFLEKLCKDISETVDLLIFDGKSLFSLATIFPKQFLRAVPDTTIVQPFPLHCTAVGKILLASLPGDEFDRALNSKALTVYTDNTVTDKAQIRADIEIVRRENVAYDIEEFWIGIMSVAAPLKDDSGKAIGAISIVGPTQRLTRLKLKQLAPILLDCTLQVSRSLGYKGE